MARRVPKLGLGTVVLVVAFMAKLLVPHFEDPDFYWHIKTGEFLLSSWPLPTSDIFTYTHAGSPWVLSEWLAQIVLYKVFETTGYFGTAVLVAGMCAVCGWLTYLSCRRQVDNPVQAIIVALGCSLFLVTAAPRPYLFSFVFFAAVLFVLLEFKYARRDRLLALLPPMLLVWANAHGGYFVGLALIFLFAGTEWARHVLQAQGALDTRQLGKLGLWALAALAATLVNPEGIRLWWYPFEAIVFSGDAQTINEWQSPSFHVPITQGFLVLILFFFALQARQRVRADLTEIAVPLVFVATAFISVRNMPIAAMALAPFLTRGLAQVIGAFGTPVARTPPQKNLNDHHVEIINWIVLVVAGSGLALAYPAQWKKQEEAVARYMPVAAADYLLAHHVRGNMFNSYQYGGYLVFRLYPAQRVFIYGRTDIYQDKFVRVHDAIQQGRANWKALFDTYGIDYVVCESDAALRQLLLQEGDFSLVFDDGNHSVLLKNVEKFRSLIARES